ncbi:phage regulatory protein Rha, partial [Haemophilus influenzae]
SRKRAQCT